MRIVTIGAYGFTAETFRSALQHANLDTFVDVRRRRGVRGHDYAFANSKHLQQTIADLGLAYVHIPDVAPSKELMQIETDADHAAHIRRHDRDSLAPAFIDAYNRTVLATFDTAEFMAQLPDTTAAFALFCVERVPTACHRSLLAARLAHDLNATVEHLTPDDDAN